MADEEKQTTISGRKARQGDIILRSRRRRIIFGAGLAGVVVLIFLLTLAAYG